MILNQLLKNIKPVCIKGDTDIDITGVNIDSRKLITIKAMTAKIRNFTIENLFLLIF